MSDILSLPKTPSASMSLTVEGLRRGDIDRERFSELASLVGLADSEEQALLGSVETCAIGTQLTGPRGSSFLRDKETE
jgi:hypothetical protein